MNMFDKLLAVEHCRKSLFALARDCDNSLIASRQLYDDQMFSFFSVLYIFNSESVETFTELCKNKEGDIYKRHRHVDSRL